MNTFVTHYDHRVTFARMDSRRLGKQRVECLQIIRYAIGADPDFAWASHPAVRMWARHTHELLRYAIEASTEWISRGYADNLRQRFHQILHWYSVQATTDRRGPEWLADPRQHVAHCSNLVRKDPKYYARFWPQIPADFPYIWWRYDIPGRVWIPATRDPAGYQRLVAYVKANTAEYTQCLGTSSEHLDLSKKPTSVIRGRSLWRPSVPSAPMPSAPSPSSSAS